MGKGQYQIYGLVLCHGDLSQVGCADCVSKRKNLDVSGFQLIDFVLYYAADRGSFGNSLTSTYLMEKYWVSGCMVGELQYMKCPTIGKENVH
ncbi:hypothetical protein CJ030_MR8G004363 [Morella rubra]|uniref:Gnk2-homologous domain-containing protein n=1 Tax=Morella rubra TaxID=262757 RepID=A0A6A1UPX2_9ROSI|nr:hypothetical protein CJ030_MR8G004363 [Morella rubra]